MSTTISHPSEAIAIFSDPRFGEIRTTGTPDNPLFCLADVCRVLDLTTNKVVQRLDEGVLSKYPLETPGGIQQANFVNEDGLYDTIFDSRKPEAKAFRKWVTSEVLPSIRKTGAYAVHPSSPLSSPDIASALRTMLDDYAAVKFDREKLRQDNARLTAEVKLLPSPSKRATDKIKDLTAENKRLEARVAELEKDLVEQSELLDKYEHFIKDHNLKHRVQGITASLDEWVRQMKSLSDDTKKFSRQL